MLSCYKAKERRKIKYIRGVTPHAFNRALSTPNRNMWRKRSHKILGNTGDTMVYKAYNVHATSLSKRDSTQYPIPD
jgi:hypothetical protein